MKRTTYLLIGVLLSVLMLVIAGVFYVTFQKSESNLYNPTFSDQLVTTDFDSIRFVKVYGNNTRPLHLDGVMTLTPSTDGKTRFSHSASDYVKVSRDVDTLFVCFDFTKWELPEQKKAYLLPSLNIQGLRLILETDANLVYLNSAVWGLALEANGLQADTLSISTNGGEVRLDSCRISALNLAGTNMSFKVHHSAFTDLYLDLDCVWRWSVDSCQVVTEHLAGSGKHHNTLQKGECERVLWTPKVAGAELTMTFQEKGCLVLKEE